MEAGARAHPDEQVYVALEVLHDGKHDPPPHLRNACISSNLGALAPPRPPDTVDWTAAATTD